MITIFYGSDQARLGGEVARLRQDFEASQPDGAVYRFSDEEFDQERFEELIGGGQLFGNVVMVIARNLWVAENHANWLTTQLAVMATSPTQFIFWEDGLPKQIVEAGKKSGATIQEFALKETGWSGKSDFNIFSLTDSLLSRNRRELWLRYVEATYRGVPAEEVFWKLVWQLKILLQVKQTTGELPELKPLVVSKARRGVEKFSQLELKEFSSSLVKLWHEAISGEVDLALGLEQFILRL